MDLLCSFSSSVAVKSVQIVGAGGSVIQSSTTGLEYLFLLKFLRDRISN